MQTYHRQLGFPSIVHRALSKPVLVPLDYTRHAMVQASKRGIRLADSLTVAIADVVEVTLDGGTLHKILVRKHYSAAHDICYVVLACGTVLTVWLNSKDDTHNTLDTSVYQHSEVV